MTCNKDFPELLCINESLMRAMMVVAIDTIVENEKVVYFSGNFGMRLVKSKGQFHMNWKSFFIN